MNSPGPVVKKGTYNHQNGITPNEEEVIHESAKIRRDPRAQTRANISDDEIDTHFEPHLHRPSQKDGQSDKD